MKNTGMLILIGVIAIVVLWGRRTAPGIPVPPDTLLVGNYGDVNGNGIITIVDRMFAAHAVAGIRILSPEELKRADVDGDGRVTASDVALIAQYLAGIISKFPAEGG